MNREQEAHEKSMKKAVPHSFTCLIFICDCDVSKSSTQPDLNDKTKMSYKQTTKEGNEHD